MLSPLQLKHCYYTKIHIDACEADQDFISKEDHKHKYDIQVNTQQNIDNEYIYKVIFDFKMHPEVEKNTYSVDISMEGIFVVSDTIDKEKREDVVRKSGAGILCSSVREMVSTLTSRGPFDQMVVPTISFVELTVKDL